MQGILDEIKLARRICGHYYLNIELLNLLGISISPNNEKTDPGVDIEDTRQDFIQTL